MSATASIPLPAPSSRALRGTLWTLQILLGAAFLMAGFGKAFQPMEALALKMPWTAQAGAGLTRFIGISELLGGLGLILPSATRIKPGLASLAALGLTVVMVLATLFHASRGEWQYAPVTVLLGSLTAFVAWGRYAKAPIAAR